MQRRGSGLAICLIRRRLGGSWGIPKGTVESGQTHKSAALNEAWEEAGLRGRLVGDALGTYKYRKFNRLLTVMVFAMEVLEQHTDWMEAGLRERKWASFEEAGSLLVEHPAHTFLDRARRLFSVNA